MITVAILTKNNEETIEKTLLSLKEFDEVILLDNGSTDETLKIAGRLPNVTIYKTHFTSFGDLRNQLAKKARHDWILALDSDEVLSAKLSNEIRNHPLKKDTLYDLPFHNFYRGKRVKCCGWYPESHVRLYNRTHTSFSQDRVHEKIMEKGPIHTFKYPVYHTPYRSQDDFLRKMQVYSQLFADQNVGKKSSFQKALSHGVWAFFRSYILKKGIFYGETGFTLSLYNANTAFYKYLKLKEKNATHSPFS